MLSNVQSIYLWKNEVCHDQEHLLMIKTSSETVDACIQRLKKIHPYDVPEMISIPIDEQHSSIDYLQWIASVCTPRN